jgi:catechol 2,3-dioxygenase-like lactoylglutathione lyase family enzyme/quercetin dioxygenase-like cupin family protein
MKQKEPHTFQRTPSVKNSLTYMGSILSFLAKAEETGGRFALMEYRSRPGHEPPPHVHEREHELIYVLEGTLQFFCEDQVLTAGPGEVVFIPQGKPHAFYTLSENVRMLAFVQATGTESVGLDRYFGAMGEPALSLDLPDHAITYANADLQRVERLAQENGCRLLTPEETAIALPQYPGFGRPQKGSSRGIGHPDSVETKFDGQNTMSEEKKKTARHGPRVGGCRDTGVHHVGLYAKDPTVTAEFYRDVMGMQIVGGSCAEAPMGASAFLSSRPGQESHEIALFTNPALRHVAFKVASLAELRAFYQRVCDRKLTVKMAANHGVSLAFYFDDPDGNMIEVYWPTGLRCRQPFMEPLDLAQSEEALRATLRIAED